MHAGEPLRGRPAALAVALASLLLAHASPAAESARMVSVVANHPLEFIDTSYENASPVQWEVRPDGIVDVYLMYDYERSSPNRAAGHWNFRVQARAGSDLTLVLNNLSNVWNGRRSSPASERTIAFVSDDGKSWRAQPMKLLDVDRLQLQLHLKGDSLFVARLEPYGLSHLEALKKSLAPSPFVEITAIGRTVEGRELEIVRLGRPDAPRRVLLRARAHPWEPGGNWVVEGLLRRLARGDAEATRWLARYCVYVLPMANKDGVARGRTRFNSLGMDLNRNWERPADRRYAPENVALETWIEETIRAGRRPHLALDLHNDQAGKLLVSRVEDDGGLFAAQMERLEKSLRQHSFFVEGSVKNPIPHFSDIGGGLLKRYEIPACVLELNANWLAGLNDYPTAVNWQRFGEQLAEVFYRYFAEP